MSFDPFEIEESGELSDSEKQKVVDYHTMIYETFRTESGKKLLERWMEDFIFSPIVIAGQPLESHGIREGKASLVRHIMKTITMIENNYYQPEENSSDE